MDEVAQALGPLGLEIRRSVDEISRKSVVALVSSELAWPQSDRFGHQAQHSSLNLLRSAGQYERRRDRADCIELFSARARIHQAHCKDQLGTQKKVSAYWKGVGPRPDALMHVCSFLSHPQVEVIMTAPDEAYCVTSLVALRECASLKPAMTKRAGEELLGNLVRHGWLRRSA